MYLKAVFNFGGEKSMHKNNCTETTYQYTLIDQAPIDRNNFDYFTNFTIDHF